MGRSRRAVKNNKIKMWIPILIIVLFVVGITFYMIKDIRSKIDTGELVDTDKEIEKIDEQQNIISKENIIDEESVSNEVESNTVIENTVSNTVSNTTSTSNITKNNSTVVSKPATTDDKQKAIELVKKEWGNDDSVSYSFDYINENGEYVVAVKDKASATVKYYFRVDLKTETVELD